MTNFSPLQIPEEEKNLGPHDRLIHVYHFMKDTTQNQAVSTSVEIEKVPDIEL